MSAQLAAIAALRSQADTVDEKITELTAERQTLIDANSDIPCVANCITTITKRIAALTYERDSKRAHANKLEAKVQGINEESVRQQHGDSVADIVKKYQQ